MSAGALLLQTNAQSAPEEGRASSSPADVTRSHYTEEEEERASSLTCM